MAILYGEIDKDTKREKIHYNRGDMVASQTINDIQDTAIDAHNMATEALDKADSVFQGNGTVVSVGGREVGTLAFSSDPQQQLDTLNAKITTSSSFNAEIVDQLPTENISSSTFYLVPNSTSTDDNTYSEYLYVNGKWELLGNTQVQAYDDSELRELINGLSTTKANKTDLANYYTKDQTYNTTEVDAKVINLVSTSYLKSELNPIKTDVNTNKTNIATLQTDIVGKADKTDLNNYTKTSDLAKVATSNDYNDLDNTPNTDLMVDIINEHSDSINEINTELAGKADKSEIPSISGLASETYVNTQVNTLQGKIDGKQDKITDLDTIRSGASAGATAVQPSALNAQVSTLQGNIDKKVDKTTTINSKPLSTNITLSASDVDALPNTTKYGASLSLTMNTSTYVVTAQLKDQAGNNLGTAQTIDLPLESVVVSGSYDATNKKVILTLKDGSTIDFSVADLIDGLASQSSVDAKYEKPSTGIPKTDLASDIQTSLGKADTALQSIPAEYITETELNAKGYASQSDLDTINANVSANATAINNKLDKVTNSTTTQVYGVDATGQQTMYTTSKTSINNNIIVQRTTDGHILVPLVPSGDNASTSKSYVDTKGSEIYSHINSEVERVEGLIANAGGTVVTVGSTPVTSLKFDSNPQTQITNLETSLYNTKVILESNVSTNASDIDKLETSVTNLQNNKADKAEIPTDYVKYDENTAVDTNVINPQYVNKVSGATANNLASLDVNGNLLDSGISKSNVALKSDIPDVSKFITSGSLTSSSATNVKSWGVKLSSGLIFNWGYVTPANDGTPVSFPVPFTTTTYSIGATNYSVNTSQCRALAVYTYNTASFVCKGQWSQNSSGITSGDVTFRWVAIGY